MFVLVIDLVGRMQREYRRLATGGTKDTKPADCMILELSCAFCAFCGKNLWRVSGVSQGLIIGS